MFGYTHPIVQNDMEEIFHNSFPWFNLENKCFLVTGGNGMIATYLIYTLMHFVIKYKMKIKVIALVRNAQKAQELFGQFYTNPNFILLSQDISQPINYAGKIDYVFHFAGNASPYFIQNDPVGIMKSNLIGTMNVLEMARDKEVEKVIFASTREVYGQNDKERLLTETSYGYIDCLDKRSCYPESKRAAETLCQSYYSQYGVKFNIVRIAHAYGPGMKLEHDGRVMADLMACVVNNQNIILKSKGEALRSFCYLNDVVSGIMHILLFGKKAEAYNLANEIEEISIYSLAKELLKICNEKKLRIEFQLADSNPDFYCNYPRVKLDTRKLENLSWRPVVKLEEGLKRTLKSFD